VHSERTTMTITVHCQRTVHALGCLHFSLLWFLRVSEYTNLRWRDAMFSSDCISITLCQSKTDPFHCGCTVVIYSTKSSTCPTYAFNHHQKLSGSMLLTDPVFQAGRFKPLSWAAVTKTLHVQLHQAGVNDLQYALHCFRIGAATTAAAVGLSAWLIKQLGRW